MQVFKKIEKAARAYLGFGTEEFVVSAALKLGKEAENLTDEDIPAIADLISDLLDLGMYTPNEVEELTNAIRSINNN